jgi:hypothetical protein
VTQQKKNLRRAAGERQKLGKNRSKFPGKIIKTIFSIVI